MDANDLCRIAGNVAHVHKTNLIIRNVLVTVDAKAMTIMGGDPYAVARDWAPAEGFTANRGDRVVAELPREGLDSIASFTRQHPKEDVALSWFPGDGLVMQAGASRESVPETSDPTPPGVWEELAALLERYEDPSTTFLLNMALAARFRLIKSDKNERRADWMVRDPEEPILIKYGPTFRGLMMPLKREKHAEAVGQEGLW
jgi:hypothetical protein